MSEQRIDFHPPTVRAAVGVQKTGTATDRRPRREEGKDKRRENETPRKRRHLYDLLFDEIDQVQELQVDQRERLKRNIRAHLALRARDQTPLPTVMPEEPRPETAETADTAAARQTATEEARAPPPDDEEARRLLDIAAPRHPGLPPDELELNAQLAAQLLDCLTRNTDTARKVATYLRILLSIDGALAPHLVIEI